MPDMLGYIIQLLQLLRDAEFGWLANSVLVIMVFLSLLYYFAFVIFNHRVQKLLIWLSRIFNRMKPQISEAMTSPYDIDLANNKAFIFSSIIVYYYFSLGMFLYSLIFIAIGYGWFIENELSIGKQFLAYMCGGLFYFFARYFKCQGDKELFKFRQ